MPLSEHEQRLLEQIERALVDDDPKFASSVRTGDRRLKARRKLQLGALLVVVGLAVLPAVADSSPGYVSDILAVGNGGTAVGDLGLLETLSTLQGVGYVAGGLVFGIALLRGRVLARWAALLLALGTVAAAAIPMLPDVNPRLFAIPTGVALIGLGHSLWSEQRAPAARPVSGRLSLELDHSGAT